MPVVNEETFREIFLRDRTVGLVHDVGAIVFAGLTHSKWELAGWVNSAVKDVNEGISGLLAGKTSKEDSRDVWVVDERLDNDRAGCMNNDDGVVAVGGDVSNKGFAVVPEGEIATVALIAINGDVALARVSIDESEADGSKASSSVYLSVSVIVGDRLDNGTILKGTRFDGL